ncbi:MAG: hypothetical protein C4326_01075 [Ignavibacteria bacterium]
MSLRDEREHPFVVLLTRFAAPALILVFYVTAALHFEYTPEGTYASLVALDDLSSLGGTLITLASFVHLDVLLAAKVFSMLFCCIALLFSYLIAYEVLGDRLLALSALLALSTQAWLVQVAPSGSGVGFFLVLILAAIFFLLRNDYLLATIVAGVATLVSWQSIFLLPVMVLDAYINSVDKARSMKLIPSILLVFVAVLQPWVLYAIYARRPFLPNEMGSADVPTLFPHLSFEMVLLVGVMFVGVALLAMRERELLRTHTAPLLWIAAASFTHHRLFALTLPLIIVYAFFSVQHIMRSFARAVLPAHIAGVVFTALVLAYNQFVLLPVTTRTLEESRAVAAELKTAALWVKANARAEETVNAPEGFMSLVTFYAARRVGVPNAHFLISDQADVAGFEMVFDPVQEQPEFLLDAVRYKVWRRK